MHGFTRSIQVDVVNATFPSGVPSYLSSLSNTTIDMAKALLLLGSVTVPGGFSQASAASHWAFVRYMSALTSHSDLRIAPAYAQLDTHQMTILSDDFGVAVGTQFMMDRLGGVKDIVDGRRFLLQYQNLLGRPVQRLPKKVGPSKCPDFVLLDHAGKWHVLECKGTQSTGYLNTQMGGHALDQKKVIQIKPAVRGSSLISGVFIANKIASTTKIRIVDPEPDEPVVTIGKSRGKAALKAVRRLATSRALGLAGFPELGDELSLPPEMSADTQDFYFPEERRRFSQSSSVRLTDAITFAKERVDLLEMPDATDRVGRDAILDISAEGVGTTTGRKRVRVSVSVPRSFVEAIVKSGANSLDAFDELEKQHLGAGIEQSSDDYSVTIRQGDLLCARMEFV